MKVRAARSPTAPAAIGVAQGREHGNLVLWASTTWGTAKFWMSVLTDLRDRGIEDTLLRRLRRAEGPTGGGRQRLAAGGRAELD